MRPTSAEAIGKHQLLAAARKAKTGCLRAAAHILVSEGKAEPMQDTADEVFRLTCRAGTAADVAAQRAARDKAAKATWTRIPGHTVRDRIFAAQAGAEPGLSSWRNSHLRPLIADSSTIGIVQEWVQLWTDGLIASEIG